MQLFWLIWIVMTNPTQCDLYGHWEERTGTIEAQLAERVASTSLTYFPTAFLNGWYYRQPGLDRFFGDSPPWLPGGQCNKPTSPPPIAPGPRVYQVHRWRTLLFNYCKCQGDVNEDVAVRCEGILPHCEILGVYNTSCCGWGGED